MSHPCKSVAFCKYFTALACLFPAITHATTYQVGSTRSYVSPHALYLANVVQAGDTIEIDGETYSGTACLARWGSDNLLIRGVNGRPHLEADSEYILGKGIWVLAGNTITVDNIEFSGATVPDQNGAGIRLDGIGLTVRHCYFHDNEDGILTSNQGVGDILIEYTEFDHNGYGDGYSHNLYVGHVNSLTFRFNYSHHAVTGHNLKSRANENYVYYNRIMDEETGSSSRLIDLPNGGFCIVMGNLFMQGNNAPNSNMIGYGQEGLSNSPNEFYFINNSLVNKRTASCLFVDIGGQPAIVNIFNNIFAGTGTLTHGSVSAFDHNLVETDITAVRFADEPNYDYHLLGDSPAIDYGIVLGAVNGHSLTPEFEYVHPTDSVPRIPNTTIDAGAYEYVATSATPGIIQSSVDVFPNPTPGYLQIRAADIVRMTIYDRSGRLCLNSCASGQVDLTPLPAGMYFILLHTRSGQRYLAKVMKE